MDNRSYRLLTLAGQSQTEFQFFSSHFANTPVYVAFSPHSRPLPIAMLSLMCKRTKVLGPRLLVFYPDLRVLPQFKIHRLLFPHKASAIEFLEGREMAQGRRTAALALLLSQSF